MEETRTLQGETIDAVLYRVYGFVNELLLEQVYTLNPSLPEYGLVFPLGVTIILPQTPAAREIPTVHLWD